ncbi:hypothetical protein D3C86_2024360 [compost metagenome]
MGMPSSWREYSPGRLGPTSGSSSPSSLILRMDAVISGEMRSTSWQISSSTSDSGLSRTIASSTRCCRTSCILARVISVSVVTV